MRYVNPAKAAISVGSVLGLWHLTWVTIVALGWAQPVMDFILRLHFIELDYTLAPFALGTAALLVAITFSIGAVFGLVFALIWNWLAAEKRAQPIGKAAPSVGT
ncbi:MAG TPA: hypothetical protein VFO51_04150 [Sphingomicrobium sp.]|nr:hypothetical protein [Sphingomicrobium sp.]